MAQSDLLKRYLDAGIAFTQMTRQRAEEIVRDLVEAGEVQSDQVQQFAQDLLDRSRENTERLIEIVRKEITEQVTNLGLVNRDDLARLRERVESLARSATPGRSGASAPKKAPAPKVASVAKTAAKKAAPAKKSPVKKAAAATKSTAKKAPVRKSPVKKAGPAKKTAAKKS